eukprot:TRINITY_DN2718_c0_g1_i2.p1 TRINITY_DN2718_c0_g1~~TRINITY_DN2718_c0_g1_i2.p1  ORF type:complete len:167 (+),score=10.03 TRINITY_DN2718_c0_g1_i2:552-1052(+)
MLWIKILNIYHHVKGNNVNINRRSNELEPPLFIYLYTYDGLYLDSDLKWWKIVNDYAIEHVRSIYEMAQIATLGGAYATLHQYHVSKRYAIKLFKLAKRTKNKNLLMRASVYIQSARLHSPNSQTRIKAKNILDSIRSLATNIGNNEIVGIVDFAFSQVTQKKKVE